MKLVLVDASSAILLFKAALLERVAACYELTAVPAVYKEITVAGQPGALFFERMVSGGLLRVCGHERPAALFQGFHTLGAGERDTMIAFFQYPINFVIMDDRKGASLCRSKKIPYINALLCPKILLFSGHADAGVCEEAFGRLLRIGRYSRWVREFAERAQRSDLELFLP
ncbi:MAG: hypothetical protein M0036_23915 [Desulfobacteraceae bacterium]|nr:hypothetical protein [Desulfobacteraceae bacterium]